MSLYFEDLKVGDKFVSPTRTVTEADIYAFAGLTGDYNLIHVDRHYAEQGPFKQRIAHGLLTLAISTGLGTRLGLFTDTVIAFLGIESLKFTNPVFIGDTIHQVEEVIDVKKTSKPGRGVVTMQTNAVKHDGTVVLESKRSLMVKCRG
ncbi:MAG: MaoC family dehydratase N-terminal domain-containing protein [Planctomycetes bacterium]|nr:MaoC family dehydratase N-terminal domain-containing protein [Planctomycetota bacterium]